MNKGRTVADHIREVATKMEAEGQETTFVLLSYRLANDPDHIECDFGFNGDLPDPHLIQVVGEHFIRKAEELRARYAATRTAN